MKLPKVRYVSGAVNDLPPGTTRDQFYELKRLRKADQVAEFDKEGFSVCYCAACYEGWK